MEIVAYEIEGIMCPRCAKRWAKKQRKKLEDLSPIYETETSNKAVRCADCNSLIEQLISPDFQELAKKFFCPDELRDEDFERNEDISALLKNIGAFEGGGVIFWSDYTDFLIWVAKELELDLSNSDEYLAAVGFAEEICFALEDISPFFAWTEGEDLLLVTEGGKA